MTVNFTLLTEKQIWGDDYGRGQLDVMDKYDTAVAPTDLVILLGADTEDCGYRTSEDEGPCVAWTATSYDDVTVRCVDVSGMMGHVPPYLRYYSVRPVLSSSETQKLQLTNKKIGVNGVEIVEYGEYPQTLADKKTSQALEDLYQSESLQKTGKNYTFDAYPAYENTKPFKADPHPEYEYQGKKYVRVEGQRGSKTLTTGEKIIRGKPYWVEVKPIEWLKDPSGIWISKKCLFSGIQFMEKYGCFYDIPFKKTFMKKYLDTYFAKEIEPSELTIVRERKTTLKGLSEKLEEISNLDEVKATITPARTPERTEELVRITRIRRAKEVLAAAAKKAHEEGNQETLQEIMEIAKPYAVREAVVRDKLRRKRMERRSKIGRG